MADIEQRVRIGRPSGRRVRPPSPLRDRTVPRRTPHWEAFEEGMGRQVRSRWRRDGASPEPRLDALDAQAGRTRLVDVMPSVPTPEKDQRFVRHTLQALMIVVVAGQRITFPLGASPVSLSLVAAFVGLLILRTKGGIRYNRVRTELYIAAAVAIMVSTWFATLLDSSISLSSMFLLLVLYIPWMFCVSPAFLDQMRSVLRVFVRLMMVLGGIGVFQMLGQLSGAWQYKDYLATWLPPDWIAQGYNTENQISYFDTTVKANAFVFLEPSFLCQFLGLALVISLLIKAPAWQPLVLGLGMAATLSGTGILLVAVGVVIMVFRAPGRIRPSYVIAALLGLVIIFQTPAADILLNRRDETSQQGSSGYLRFVQPYQEVAKGFDKDPTRYVVGAGAGQSDRLLESDRNEGEAVVYPIAPKLAFEYGLATMVIFVAFLLVAILRGPPLPVLPATIVFMTFFLSGSLLQPHTMLLAWLLTSVWGPPVTVGVSDALAALRRLRGAVLPYRIGS